MTDWKAEVNNEADGWKIADQQISREIPASELSELDNFPSLSHEDTLALEAMAANRLKVNKPEPIAEYRKPKSSLMPPMGMVIRNTMLGAIVLGLIVAFYLGLSGAKLATPAPSHVVRAPEPVRTKVATPRHVHSYSAASRSGGSPGSANATASAKATSAKPVIDNTPIPEYKGPSSLTGANVTHRHAYQTITAPGAGE